MQRLNMTRSCLAALLLAGSGLVASSHALAYQNGPAPTFTSIQANGPYAVSTQTVYGSGFGGATVYSPNTAGKYAVVAVCPGFFSTQSSIAAISRRLATHGFVVATINTKSVFDYPPRGMSASMSSFRMRTCVA